MVFPSTCQIPSGVYYKTECFFTCNVTAGYQLEGASKVFCLASGSWSDDTTKTICRGTKDLHESHDKISDRATDQHIIVTMFLNQENEVMCPGFNFCEVKEYNGDDSNKKTKRNLGAKLTSMRSCCMALADKDQFYNC